MEKSVKANDSVVVAARIEPEQEKEVAELPIVDTGQTWFRVRITKKRLCLYGLRRQLAGLSYVGK